MATRWESTSSLDESPVQGGPGVSASEHRGKSSRNSGRVCFWLSIWRIAWQECDGEQDFHLEFAQERPGEIDANSGQWRYEPWQFRWVNS